ncbi:hypothetical protein DRJ17_01605 [Candidatus Woesearchaeota archaeon]|nr:MAG: hypothetical protein DRJ17_01605 [Candidatus Woesearchaeota archaeon]
MNSEKPTDEKYKDALPSLLMRKLLSSHFIQKYQPEIDAFLDSLYQTSHGVECCDILNNVPRDKLKLELLKGLQNYISQKSGDIEQVVDEFFQAEDVKNKLFDIFEDVIIK